MKIRMYFSPVKFTDPPNSIMDPRIQAPIR